MKFLSSIALALLIAAVCVHAGVVVSWRRSPSPVPIPSSSNTSSPSPWSEPGNVTDGGFVPLLRNGQLFNESVSVPITERTDTISPLPAMIAAEDFHMPLALQSCTALVADLVLFRQLGRTGSNYRVPTRTTFWLLPATAMSGPFNKSRALAERVYAQPLEGTYDPPGTTGGSTVDRGNGYYYHIERLRFVLSNITLRANTTYWLAVLVSIDRAYNASDFTQNAVRWAISESATSSSNSYRVVDWHHNTFRDAPALANWSDASVAETYILPSLTAVNTRSSRTRQLALDLYVTGCTNVTRLPTSITVLASLPPRESNPVSIDTTPSWNQSPTREVVIVETPIAPSSATPFPVEVPSPPEVPSSTWPSPINVPSSTWPSPPPAVPSSGSVWQPPSPSLARPSSSPPWSEASSPVTVPSPPFVSSWAAPSPTTSSAAVTQEPSPAVEKVIDKNSGAITLQVWVIVGFGALLFLVLLMGLAFIGVRCYHGSRKYTNIDYATYRHEQDDASNESPRSQQKQPLAGQTDASEILLDDMSEGEEYADEVVPASRDEAKAKQDMLLMQPVPLDDAKH